MAVVKCLYPPPLTSGAAQPAPVRRVVRFYGGREGECPAQAPIDSPTHPHPHPPRPPPLYPSVFSQFLIPEFQLLGWMACSNCSWVDNIWRVAHSCPTVSFSPGWPLPGDFLKVWRSGEPSAVLRGLGG